MSGEFAGFLRFGRFVFRAEHIVSIEAIPDDDGKLKEVQVRTRNGELYFFYKDDAEKVLDFMAREFPDQLSPVSTE